MIKIPFFRKNFLQVSSVKIPIWYRRSRMLNLFDRLKRSIIRMLKKINISNLATAYCVDIRQPSFSVILQLKLAVDTEANLARAYLINPPLIGKV